MSGLGMIVGMLLGGWWASRLDAAEQQRKWDARFMDDGSEA